MANSEILEKLKAENKAQIDFYKGRNEWAFNTMQEILDKKEKGDISIDLDIQKKVFNQVHADSVKAYNFAKMIERYIDDAIKQKSEVEDGN